MRVGTDCGKVLNRFLTVIEGAWQDGQTMDRSSELV